MRSAPELRSYSQTIAIPQPDFDDIEESCIAQQPSFKHVLDTIDPENPLPSITPDTMYRLLRMEIDTPFTKIIPVDCRYDYEYEDGHIKGAKSLITFTQLIQLFNNSKGKRHAFIFYCEYSSIRSPKWMHIFRKYDRDVTTEPYPAVTFPDVYLLHGGFKQFYSLYPNFCDGHYRPMDDHAGRLKECKALFDKETQKFYDRAKTPRQSVRVTSKPVLAFPLHTSRGIQSQSSN